MRNFDTLESSAFEHNDTCLLIDDACENGSTEQFRAYVKQIFTCAVQGMITEDILEEQGIDFDEDLMDWIGDIYVSIPDELCDFYKGKTYYEEALNELREYENLFHVSNRNGG